MRDTIERLKETREVKLNEGDIELSNEATSLIKEGESLLSLVQPELALLSYHWSVALKDYAFLCLPNFKLFFFF